MTNSRVAIVLLTCTSVVAGLILGFCELSRHSEIPASSPKFAEPLPGIENLIQVAPGLLCGSQPISEQAFAALRSRGVEIIVSVDGIPPDVTRAEKQGLRYVHLPMGYDGIDSLTRSDLLAVMRLAPTGSVYVHCHHGRHRGPAAAAYAGISTGVLSKTGGLQLLTLAGTKPEYVGLWDAIRDYQPPQRLVRPLVSKAKVEPLTATMGRIGQSWEAVKGTFASLPGAILSPSHHADAGISQSLLLAEEFREAVRLGEGLDPRFQSVMSEAAMLSQQLHESILKNDLSAIGPAAKRIEETCVRCHSIYRN